MFKKKKNKGLNYPALSIIFIIISSILSIISSLVTNKTISFLLTNITYFVMALSLVCFGYIISNYMKKNKKVDLLGILIVSIIINVVSYLSLYISNQSGEIFIFTFSIFIYISVFLNIISLILIAIDWIKKNESKKIIQFFVISLSVLLVALYFIYLSNSLILQSDTLFNYAGYVYIMAMLNIFTFCFTYLIRKIVYPNK